MEKMPMKGPRSPSYRRAHVKEEVWAWAVVNIERGADEKMTKLRDMICQNLVHVETRSHLVGTWIKHDIYLRWLVGHVQGEDS